MTVRDGNKLLEQIDLMFDRLVDLQHQVRVLQFADETRTEREEPPISFGPNGPEWPVYELPVAAAC